MVESHADLSLIFKAVAASLLLNRETLNGADSANGNHGDHMLEIFKTAAQVLEENPGLGLAEALDLASQRLALLSGNGSAQVYSQGLARFASQFREHQVSLDQLLLYVRSVARNQANESSQGAGNPNGEVLKALVGGLNSWRQSEPGPNQSERKLDMGALFEMGIAYLQAKQRGGSRLEILADAAASASPLSQLPYRYQSGKLALHALLQAML